MREAWSPKGKVQRETDERHHARTCFFFVFEKKERGRRGTRGGPPLGGRHQESQAKGSRAQTEDERSIEPNESSPPQLSSQHFAEFTEINDPTRSPLSLLVRRGYTTLLCQIGAVPHERARAPKSKRRYEEGVNSSHMGVVDSGRRDRKQERGLPKSERGGCRQAHVSAPVPLSLPSQPQQSSPFEFACRTLPLPNCLALVSFKKNKKTKTCIP